MSASAWYYASGSGCLVLVLAMLATVQPLSALTIYRIGGSDLPPPESEVAFEYVQLQWEEVDEERHGRIVGIDLETGIAPMHFTPDLNLVPLIRQWGGRIRFYECIREFNQRDALQEEAQAFDSDLTTAYEGGVHGCAKWFFDFGTPIIVERLFHSTRSEFAFERYVRNFAIETSERELVEGWQTGNFSEVYKLTQNTDAVVDLAMPPTPVRELGFYVLEGGEQRWEIAEIELYSSGYIPRARYVSNLIDLGKPASLGALAWSGRRDPAAHMEVRLRGGGDDDPNLYHRYTFRDDEQVTYGSEGQLLSRADYDALGIKEQGTITHDAANWDFWSPADIEDGAGAVTAGRPWRFAQFDVSFLSTVDDGARIDYLQFAVSEAVATRLVAEIEPGAVAPGVPTTFTFRLRPQLEPGDPGFDTIAIDTPQRPLAIESVRLNGVEVDLTVVRIDGAGFAVRVPHIDIGHTLELIEIDFRTQVFDYGTLFGGRVYDSARPDEVPQPIQPGDADKRVDSNTLRVALQTIPRRSIHAMQLSTPMFTPNGDQVNDVLHIDYDLLNLTGGTPVTLAVYDLSGRAVGEIFHGEAASGRSSIEWDGDSRLGLVTPGIYVLQLTVETDTGEESARRVVSVVY